MNAPTVKDYHGFFRAAASTILEGRRFRVYSIPDITQEAHEYVDVAKDSPTSLASAYVAIRAVKEQLSDAVDELNKLVENLKTTTLPQLFEDHDVRHVAVNVDGTAYRVGVSQRVVASIKADAKGAAYDWLRTHELGALVIETVNASTLASTAKTMLEEGKELDPDLFNVAIMPTTSVTKIKDE